MMYLGDYLSGDTVYFMWNSNSSTGASVTRSTNGTISVYKGSNTTQVTTGVTDTEDYDALTGVHHVAIVTTDSFYAPGQDYMVVLSAATIDGVTVNACLAHFSIQNRYSNGLVWHGFAAAGAAGTATLGTNSFADDEINGGVTAITQGTGKGQARVNTDFVASTEVVSHSPNWTTTPTTGSWLEVFAGPPAPTVSGSLPQVDLREIAGTTVSTTAAQLGVNVVQLSTDATAADNAEAFFDGTGYAGTGNTIPTVTDITTKTGYRLSSTGVDDILRTALVEAYAADGAAGTLSQILFGLQAFLQEKSISGTTLTVKKLDGATTAMTFTLNDATTPTSVTRAT